MKLDISKFRVPPETRVNLDTLETDWRPKGMKKKDAGKELQQDVQRLCEMQDKLYAQDTHSLLLVFQALDAAGKDSCIKHVLSGVNPQGVDVSSFKQPSTEELDHDFLWRCNKRLPERGRIGIFNRSYYEEVLVVRVHPDFLKAQHLPPKVLGDLGKDFWNARYETINNFENHLVQNGITVVKFFLHVSKDEQKRRFLDRINEPEKNWKFSPTDVKERQSWGDYMQSYRAMLRHTSTKVAPWYVVPADRKWVTRMIVMRVILETLEGLNLKYPKLDNTRLEDLKTMRKVLEDEK